MKPNKFLLILLLFVLKGLGQNLPKEYYESIKAANALYESKDYKSSAIKYTETFKTFGDQGFTDDFYNAACSYALANDPNNSFFYLERIVTKEKYNNYDHITTDTDLNSLHQDKRWNPLIEQIKKNKENADSKLNKPLVELLAAIQLDDQQYRRQLNEVEKKFGVDSNEIKTLWKTIEEKDANNINKVSKILDENGWLGPDVITWRGIMTMTLVIQHADLTTQLKYLPLLREAVKKGNAMPNSLALLEDRVAMKQGKSQIYGSQIKRDPETNLYYVYPVEDPANLDKRRASVGLDPMSNYVKQWKIEWNLEQYIKDLPVLEAKNKKK